MDDVLYTPPLLSLNCNTAFNFELNEWQEKSKKFFSKRRGNKGSSWEEHYVTYLCSPLMLDKNGKACEVIRFADS